MGVFVNFSHITLGGEGESFTTSNGLKAIQQIMCTDSSWVNPFSIVIDVEQGIMFLQDEDRLGKQAVKYAEELQRKEEDEFSRKWGNFF